MWTLSKALVESCESLPCSQGQAVESSVVSCSDGEQSAPLKKKSMPEAYLCGDRTKDTLNRSRSGMTYAPLTEDRGKAVLTSFLAASRARTYQPQEKGQALAVPDLGYGGRWRGLSVKYDPALSSWKTARSLFPEVLDWSCLTLPRWGTMRDGELWALTTQVLPTAVSASGYLPLSRQKNPGLDSLQQAIFRKGWTTPSASDATRGGTITENMTGTSLAQQVNTPSMWPTPTVHGNHNRKGASKNSGTGLQTAVKEAGGIPIRQTAPLNPEWVAWLMGWPIGWTGSKPLETVKFRRWLRLHGEHCGG